MRLAEVRLWNKKLETELMSQKPDDAPMAYRSRGEFYLGISGLARGFPRWDLSYFDALSINITLLGMARVYIIVDEN